MALTDFQTQENTVKKQHYFLVAGTIIFHNDNAEIGQVLMNCIITNNDRNFPARLIGRAQQTLQIQFFKNIEDPTQIKVVDVPITSICHLGIMTEKEFHAAPEGMQVAERVVNDPFADNGPAAAEIIDLSTDTKQ